MTSRNQHVTKRGDGSWQVKGEGASRAYHGVKFLGIERLRFGGRAEGLAEESEDLESERGSLILLVDQD